MSRGPAIGSGWLYRFNRAASTAVLSEADAGVAAQGELAKARTVTASRARETGAP